jgi:Ca2+-binding EF-hand superfamily protein
LGPEDEFIEYVYGEDGVRRKKVRQMVYQDREITIQEVQEIKRAFDMFDKDQSNNIETEELKDAMRALGVKLNKEDFKTLMEKADKDGSGAIDFEEFLALMVQRI